MYVIVESVPPNPQPASSSLQARLVRGEHELNSHNLLSYVVFTEQVLMRKVPATLATNAYKRSPPLVDPHGGVKPSPNPVVFPITDVPITNGIAAQEGTNVVGVGDAVNVSVGVAVSLALKLGVVVGVMDKVADCVRVKVSVAVGVAVFVIVSVADSLEVGVAV